MSYSLSIRTCVGGFSFLVHSVASGQLVIEDTVPAKEGESEADNFARMLTHPRLLGRDYERVRFLSNAPTTQIPLDDFRREDIVAIYRQVFSESTARAEDLAVQILPGLEVVCIYHLPSAIEQALREVFPQATIQNFPACLMEYVASRAQGMRSADYEGGHRGAIAFHVVIEGSNLFVVATSRGRLQYANSFVCENDADRLYFLLSVWHLLQMDSQYDTCNLYDASPEFQNRVHEFIASVKPQALPSLVYL
jgi:hypothetical protein